MIERLPAAEYEQRTRALRSLLSLLDRPGALDALVAGDDGVRLFAHALEEVSDVYNGNLSQCMLASDPSKIRLQGYDTPSRRAFEQLLEIKGVHDMYA